MKIIATALIICLSAPLQADTTKQERPDADSIYAQIAATGAPVSIKCDDGKETCTVTWTPTKGPVVFVDKMALRLTLLAELAALEVKLDAGTITQAEIRRLLKLALKLLRISKDAL